MGQVTITSGPSLSNVQIDWSTLKAQKLAIILMFERIESELSRTEIDAIDGLILLLDDVQEAAVNQKLVTEDQVYTLEGQEW